MTVKIRLGSKKPVQSGLFETDDAMLDRILKDVCPKCDGAGHVMGHFVASCSFQGPSVHIALRRLVLCPRCHGSGKRVLS